MSKENTLMDTLQENESLEALLGMEGEKDDIVKLRQHAESGIVQAKALLGLKYLHGDGVEQDIAEAMYWLEQGDDSYTMCQVGNYYRDLGDFKQAESWYGRAAAKQDKHQWDACYQLFNMYFTSKEHRDFVKAADYLETCLKLPCEEHYKEYEYQSAELMGSVLADNDPVRAIGLLKKVLAYEEKESAHEAMINAYKRIVYAEDMSMELRKEAASYLKSKEEKLDKVALYMLYAYYTKYENDPKQYLYWADKAAEAGWVAVQLELALNYLEGNKVPQDIKKADHYLSMAEKNPELKGLKKNAESLRVHIDAKKKAAEKHLTPELARPLVLELEKSGSTVLRIPEGYTHIDTWAFRDDKWTKPRIKYAHQITEVIFPESLECIAGGTFEGCENIQIMKFPENLKEIGMNAFSGVTLGLFDRTIKDKRTIEKIVIPGNTVLSSEAFAGIKRIKEMIIEDGQKELNLEFAGNALQTTVIDYLYIPDSVTIIKNRDSLLHMKIANVSAPKHLDGKLHKGIMDKIVFR